MALLNYTTSVPANRSLAEIQQALVKGGARSVMVDYDDAGQPSALVFALRTPLGNASFRLPANVAAVEKLLAGTGARSHRAGAKVSDAEHARRVAWRVIKDWVEAQLALVETHMASLDQVMFPYLQVESGATLYEAYRDRQLALPSSK